MKRFDHRSDVTVLENRVSALPRSAYDDVHNGSGPNRRPESPGSGTAPETRGRGDTAVRRTGSKWMVRTPREPFLRQHSFSERDINIVWTAIALHTTPGIPQYMHPVDALVTSGVEMDVVGIGYPDFADSDRAAVVRAYPRSSHFKEDIIKAFYDGIKHKPETTFGNVKADVSADKDPKFHRENFCSVIRRSA